MMILDLRTDINTIKSSNTDIISGIEILIDKNDPQKDGEQ